MTLRDDGEIRLHPVRADELDVYAHWMTHGRWRQSDAPWENVGDQWEPEALSQFREAFLRTAARQAESVSKCTLYVPEGPIGWVSSYHMSADGSSVKVGICICRDAYLGRGYGTRSLKLWLEYWFEDRKLHRVGLDTWSFNGPMIRVAQKCGFVPEGVEREVLRWDGAWRHLHHFGMTEDDRARARKLR